jgi:eukaryotic-like serine/threonine-protein kinase
MMHELQPGDPGLIGPYRLRRRLGAGGMGQVYLGLSPGGRAVAVKVIRADLAQDPEFRARFRREIAVARKVSGLFTAPVIDADVDGPVPWLATEYVSGPSLADAVSEHGPLPVASVLELAAGLAEGLSAIHAAGVVHRDLKPANVLLAADGPRVIDFGISRAVEASALTHTGLVVGSPGFMSPEQAEGREVGPSSDIFSLGAVLAFAATGHGPFGTGSTPALVYRVVHSLPQLDQVPAEVRPLVERCLAKDPAGRPTARDLLSGAAHPVAGWLPEPVTRAFSLEGAALTVADKFAVTGPDRLVPPAVTAADRLVPSDLPPWGAAPAASRLSAGEPPPGRRSQGRGRRSWRGGWRTLTAAAVLATLAGAGVTAGFVMTAGSVHADQSAQRGSAQTLTPASPPASSPSHAPSYGPSYGSPAAATAPRTSPTASAPAYTPPPGTPPATVPATMAPAPGTASPSMPASPGSTSPAPGSTSPAPSTTPSSSGGSGY